MSILHLTSFIFNTKTTVKPCYLTSFLPNSSISNSRFRKFTIHSTFSSFNDPQDFFVPKSPGNKLNQNDSNSDDKQISFVDEWGERSEPDTRPVTKLSESDPPINDDEWGRGAELVGSSKNSGIEDEWGEKSYSEPRPVPTVSDSDPPRDEDEWIGAKPVKNESVSDNKTASDPETRPLTRLPVSDPPKGEEERVAELKRCLMDTVYRTEFGLRASSEIRAEALELVSQLEAANPTPSPVESPELLDGNWILV